MNIPPCALDNLLHWLTYLIMASPCARTTFLEYITLAVCEMTTGTMPQSSICHGKTDPNSNEMPTETIVILLKWRHFIRSVTEVGNQSTYDITVPLLVIRLDSIESALLTVTNRKQVYFLGFPFLRDHPFYLALSLFVTWVFTDYSDTTLSFDDLTFFANRFYWRSNFHSNNLLSIKSIV